MLEDKVPCLSFTLFTYLMEFDLIFGLFYVFNGVRTYSPLQLHATNVCAKSLISSRIVGTTNLVPLMKKYSLSVSCDFLRRESIFVAILKFCFDHFKSPAVNFECNYTIHYPNPAGGPGDFEILVSKYPLSKLSSFPILRPLKLERRNETTSFKG